MIRGVFLAAALVLLVGALYILVRTAPAHVAPASEARIVLTEKGFQPESVSILVGGSVTFENATNHPFWPASNVHPDHSLYPEFDAMKPLPADSEWTFNFHKVGDWRFHDHVRSYYGGTIHVVAQ
jgi:plastocyanin